MKYNTHGSGEEKIEVRATSTCNKIRKLKPEVTHYKECLLLLLLPPLLLLLRLLLLLLEHGPSAVTEEINLFPLFPYPIPTLVSFPYVFLSFPHSLPVLKS
jgi:hypothetical protein